MATVEELTARLEALRTQRASGTRAVEYGDRRVEFQSDAAIADLERQIAAVTGQRVHTVMFATSKGLG